MYRQLSFLIGYLLCHAIAAMAADGPVASMPTGDNSVVHGTGTVVTVTATSAIRGDPVPVIIRVENHGPAAATVVIPQIIPPAETTLRVSVKGPDEPDFRLVAFPGIYCGALKGQTGPKPLPVSTIGPGQTQLFRAYLGWDFNPADERQRRWLFPAAGDYAVRLSIWQLAAAAPAGATVADAASPLVSLEAGLTVVKVVEPSAPADVAAADALLRMPNQWLLYAPACAGTSIPADVFDFRKRHGGSRYAPFTELAVIHSDFMVAVVAKDKAAAHRACGRARQAAERAETFAWPDGWRAKAEWLFRTMSEDAHGLLP